MKTKKQRHKFIDFRMWFYDLFKYTLGIPVVFDLRIKKIYLTGKKPKHLYRGEYIISSNHISFIDPVIIENAFWMRRVGFVATKEIFQKKFFNALFRGFGCIPIDKENPSLKTFREVQNRIKDGHIVSIFPEGEISRDESLGKIKSGAVTMAIMSRCDILPIYLVKRKNRWHRQRVFIGEKIHCMDYVSGRSASLAEINKITEVLMEKENELQQLANDYESNKKAKHGKKQDNK